MKTKFDIFILILILLTPNFLLGVQGQNPDPVIYINFLTPNTNPARIQWANLIEQEIAKIGINVSFEDLTGWGNIAPRTWAYPVGVEYDHIPTFEDGGYDVLFVGWLWDLDGDLASMYETTAIIPLGDNYYQYSNPTYDAIFEQYLTSVDFTERMSNSHQLQAIIYEDLPAIGIIYRGDLFGFKEGLTGIDNLLLSTSNYRIEYWDDPDDNIIKYGIPSDLSEPNIFGAESFYDKQWMSQVYGCPLKRAQGTHGWEPEVAESLYTEFNLVAGTQTVEMKLDPLAKFSDGEEVIPEDIVYSYQMHMTPLSGSADYSTMVYWFGDNSSIAVDADTGNVAGGNVTFEMTGIYNFWEYLYNIPILDKSDVEPRINARGWGILDIMPFSVADVNGDGAALVKSCGPMMLTAFDIVNSVVKLEPNPYWLGDPVDLDEFYLAFISGKDSAVASLIDGTIDIMDAQFFPDWTDFEGVTGIEGVLVTNLRHGELSINMKHPVLGTGELTPVGTPEAAKKVRHAISHCIPRQTIVDDILNGLGFPAVSTMPDGCVDFDNSLTPYTYDISLATTLMEEAGYFSTISEYSNVLLIIFMFSGIVSVYVSRKVNK
ncbi:MAG: hypothetical protein HGN29_02045 [Asgard group archaeon]|nr:hypothetical protein [Asgard group archaeon]